jgi:aquaporin Z
MRKYLAEFIGTFFLVLTIGCTAVRTGSGVIPPLAIGSILMVMVFANGHVSGAHLNPAVTLAVWLRGRCPAADVPGYMLSQVLGGAAGAFVALFLIHGEAFVNPDKRLDPARSLVAEFFFTFALCYVVLNTATARGTSGNSFYGLAIGFTVLAGAFSVGAISGGAFNPAVAIGLVIMGVTGVADLWILLAGTFAGGAVAALAFRFINPDDLEPVREGR